MDNSQSRVLELWARAALGESLNPKEENELLNGLRTNSTFEEQVISDYETTKMLSTLASQQELIRTSSVFVERVLTECNSKSVKSTGDQIEIEDRRRKPRNNDAPIGDRFRIPKPVLIVLACSVLLLGAAILVVKVSNVWNSTITTKDLDTETNPLDEKQHQGKKGLLVLNGVEIEFDDLMELNQKIQDEIKRQTGSNQHELDSFVGSISINGETISFANSDEYESARKRLGVGGNFDIERLGR